MPDSGASTPGPNPAARPRVAEVEGHGSWLAASVTLVLLSFSYGSPLLIVVGLKPITEDLGTAREVVALAAALAWVGTGLGGILMGWVADRIGIRRTVIFGAVNIALGLCLSATGKIWAIYVGHGLLLGLLGNGAMFPPLMVYVSRWFEARRGTALALISSGQYVAGMVWPTVFEHGLRRFGWQETMVGFAAIIIVAVPLIALYLQPAPEAQASGSVAGRSAHSRRVLGLPANLVMVMLCAAGFCCCVPMAIPQSHLVAFCSDVGVPMAQGAAMLSVLQACAFCSRQFWGWMADRVGGLPTLLTGSACQALAIGAFMLTQNEAGLFAISAAFGLGFSGIVPAYVLIMRELYPSSEAAWRVPMVLFVSMSGMAFGSWWAGALYDHFGFYGPAFASGVIFNLMNLTLVGFLVLRHGWGRGMRHAAA
ncbi:MAG TPA: MFS transporter [Stellaceae bacterium]|jgi:MFS family permease|nr:MFS transporter [Stellaceae bacterium]